MVLEYRMPVKYIVLASNKFGFQSGTFGFENVGRLSNIIGFESDGTI